MFGPVAEMRQFRLIVLGRSGDAEAAHGLVLRESGRLDADVLVRSPGEEALVGIQSGGGRDGECGTGIDVLHQGAFDGPVLAAVAFRLDNAESVDPQVLDSDGAADGDGVLEQLRQVRPRHAMLEMGESL